MDKWIKKKFATNTQILFSHKKEWNPVIWDSMDGFCGYYVMWNKSEKDKYCMISLIINNRLVDIQQDDNSEQYSVLKVANREDLKSSHLRGQNTMSWWLLMRHYGSHFAIHVHIEWISIFYA